MQFFTDKDGNDVTTPISGTPIMGTDSAIEYEIQVRGLTAPRVTPSDVEASIAAESYFTAYDGAYASGSPLHAAFAQVTICAIVMTNGHKIVGVNTGSVSPENFNAELGRKLARQHAIDQIWPLLGYALRQQLHEGGAA